MAQSNSRDLNEDNASIIVRMIKAEFFDDKMSALPERSPSEEARWSLCKIKKTVA